MHCALLFWCKSSLIWTWQITVACPNTVWHQTDSIS